MAEEIGGVNAKVSADTKEFQKKMDGVVKKLLDASSSVKKIAGGLAGLSNAFGTVEGSAGKAMSVVGSMAAGLAAGGPVGLAVNSIAMAVGFWTEQNKRSREEMLKLEKGANDYAKKLEDLALKYNNLGRSAKEAALAENELARGRALEEIYNSPASRDLRERQAQLRSMMAQPFFLRAPEGVIVRTASELSSLGDLQIMQVDNVNAEYDTRAQILVKTIQHKEVEDSKTKSFATQKALISEINAIYAANLTRATEIYIVENNLNAKQAEQVKLESERLKKIEEIHDTIKKLDNSDSTILAKLYEKLKAQGESLNLLEKEMVVKREILLIEEEKEKKEKQAKQELQARLQMIEKLRIVSSDPSLSRLLGFFQSDINTSQLGSAFEKIFGQSLFSAGKQTAGGGVEGLQNLAFQVGSNLQGVVKVFSNLGPIASVAALQIAAMASAIPIVIAQYMALYAVTHPLQTLFLALPVVIGGFVLSIFAAQAAFGALYLQAVQSTESFGDFQRSLDRMNRHYVSGAEGLFDALNPSIYLFEIMAKHMGRFVANITTFSPASEGMFNALKFLTLSILDGAIAVMTAMDFFVDSLGQSINAIIGLINPLRIAAGQDPIAPVVLGGISGALLSQTEALRTEVGNTSWEDAADAMDENTDATRENTRAIERLSNLPSGYRIRGTIYQSQAGLSPALPSIGGSLGGSLGGMTFADLYGL